MKGFCIIAIALLLAGCTGLREQATVVYGKGSKLIISGIFLGADTVLVQVYHGTVKSTESVEVHAYTVTLTEYEHYTVKFTDKRGRMKLIHIPCVGCGMIEIPPSIDVDFTVIGDIILWKENARREGFDVLDSGLNKPKNGCK